MEAINENGGGTIRSINYKCELVDSYEIAFDELVSQYSPYKAKFPSLHTYAPHSPLDGTWIDNVYKAKMVAALSALAAKYVGPDVVCKVPKGVFANAKFKVNECVLVPTTHRIKLVNSSDSDSLFACEGDAPDGKVLELLPLMDQDMIIPAWFVLPTTDPKGANMKVSMVKVSVGVTIQKGKSKGGDVEPIEVHVPVFVNKRAVGAGEELNYFRPTASDSKGQNKRPFDLI